MLTGDFEKIIYVLSGTLSVAITGTGNGLIGRPGDVIFVPPDTGHTLQARNGHSEPQRSVSTASRPCPVPTRETGTPRASSTKRT